LGAGGGVSAITSEPSYDEKIAAVQEDYENTTGMWRGVITTKFAAEAVLNTAPYDKDGNQNNICSWLGVDTICICNNPDIKFERYG